eukprot:2040761-Pyramimonas_sp.AAC.2
MKRFSPAYFMIGMLLFGGVLDKALAQDEDDMDMGGGGGGYGDDYGGGGGGYGGEGGGYGGGGGGYGGGGGAEDDLSAHLPGVLVLDDKTFGKVVDGRHHVFVEFYNAECSECRTLPRAKVVRVRRIVSKCDTLSVDGENLSHSCHGLDGFQHNAFITFMYVNVVFIKSFTRMVEVPTRIKFNW